MNTGARRSYNGREMRVLRQSKIKAAILGSLLLAAVVLAALLLSGCRTTTNPEIPVVTVFYAARYGRSVCDRTGNPHRVTDGGIADLFYRYQF